MTPCIEIFKPHLCIHFRLGRHAPYNSRVFATSIAQVVFETWTQYSTAPHCLYAFAFYKGTLCTNDAGIQKSTHSQLWFTSI